MINGIIVENNPVNWIDPRGLQEGFGFSPGDFNPAVQYTPQTTDSTDSTFGDAFGSSMSANGQNVINYMDSNEVQNGLGQFAWGATASPTSLLIDDNSANGMGGVINGAPPVVASVVTINVAAGLDYITQQKQ